MSDTLLKEIQDNARKGLAKLEKVEEQLKILREAGMSAPQLEQLARRQRIQLGAVLRLR